MDFGDIIKLLNDEQRQQLLLVAMQMYDEYEVSNENTIGTLKDSEKVLVD